MTHTTDKNTQQNTKTLTKMKMEIKKIQMNS